jgi:hypothetical protein
MLLQNLFKKNLIRILLFVFVLIPLSISLYFNIPVWNARASATIIWDGGGNGTSWSDPSNWNTNVVPSSADDVLIDTAVTVVVDSPITINSLILGRSAGDRATVIDFAYDAISIGALTLTNGNITIYPGASITHRVATGSTVVGKINIDIQNGDANIYGNINVNTKGFPRKQGLGAGTSGTGGWSGGGGGGAGYGGKGGNSTNHAGGDSYGYYDQPFHLGSGGGENQGVGGTGGGAVKLTVGGTTTINGNITANGGNGTNGFGGSGGGSGGSVWITTNALHGSGNIQANGGAGSSEGNVTGGGGSGGRIALYYNTNTISTAQISASGTNPSLDTNPAQKGGAGTIYLKQDSATHGDLVIDNKTTYANNHSFRIARTPLDSNLNIDTLTITNFAHVHTTDTVNINQLNINGSATFNNYDNTTTNYNSINWTGGRIIDNGGTFAVVSSGASLTVPATSTLFGNTPRTFANLTISGNLTHNHNTTTEVNKIDYTVTGDMTLESGGTINVSILGLTRRSGLGAGTSGTGGWPGGGGGGAGYGGKGGNSTNHAGGDSYGYYDQPFHLGSGGGENQGVGGTGGGAVKLTVGGTTTINGNITANGGNGTNGFGGSGGGSGGSVWITTNALHGSGNIQANGGAGSSEGGVTGGGGSGGRIAMYYNTNTISTAQISASGTDPSLDTSPAQKGGAGTIYLKQSSATHGDLVIDNKTTYANNHSFRIARTPLDSNLNIDTLTITNFAHVHTTDTVNINQLNINGSATFNNYDNTTTNYNSINWTGGRIIDNGGTFAVVSSGASLTVPATSTLFGNTPRTFANLTISGNLTHNHNTTTEVNKIDYTVTGDMTLESGGTINVSILGLTRRSGLGAGSSGGGGWSGASGSGAGYGGTGGNSIHLAGGASYGYYDQPFNLGSGGGENSGVGGTGGGAVKLTVSGTTTVNGNITANGGNGTNSFGGSGGGSGGSVWITTNALHGSGNIQANGGAGSSESGWTGGGGSGGRIALYYNTNTISTAQISASGTNPSLDTNPAQKGGAGTIYLKQDSATHGDLVIDNKTTYGGNNPLRIARTPLESNLNIDTLTITNFAHVHTTNTASINQLNIIGSGNFHNQSSTTTTYNSIDWTGGLIFDNGGNFTLVNDGTSLTIPATSTLFGNQARTFTGLTVNGVLSHWSNTSVETHKLDYTINGDITVNSTGSINANGRGYSAYNGPGGAAYNGSGAGGASHAGVGGNGSNGTGSTVIYGTLNAPFNLGSGGGSGNGTTGGSGGGIIKLVSSGNLVVGGTISANGSNGGAGTYGAGGGAGGSVWIHAETISGAANIRANGGNGGNGNTSTRHGGGGGGGRVALYYKSKSLENQNITANGGSATSTALAGETGTIFLGGFPADPVNLGQFKLDGTTAIGIGASTDEGGFVAKMQVRDGNDTDTLTAEVEIRPLGTTFSNLATHTGNPVAYTGSLVNAQVTVDSLADNTSYHWQARVCDATALCSSWVSFGNNPESEADFTISTNAPPNLPTIPESSFYINGQLTNNLQPTLGFVLSDPNNLDTVRYRIQIDTNPDFNTPIIDYTSALGAQGTFLFTVGQGAGDGTYLVGEEGLLLTTQLYYWRVRAIDDKDSASSWSVAPGTPAFQIDLTIPTNATNMRMKAHADALHEYEESEQDIWFRRNDLFFSWDPGSDVHGVKGYCVYLGQDPEGDPAVNKGILGTSPISTTGTTCQFITDQTEIDFANTAYRNMSWLFSSNNKFYFKVKTIDIAHNIFNGPDDTNFVSFKFDNTQPQNVTAILSPSTTYSSTADIYFQWPTGGGQQASDEHSGVLGFQYALNTQDTWYGEQTDEFTNQVYVLMDREQPFYLPSNVRDLIQLGQNTLFFRVIDNAGNFSELRTAFINYGGEAPKFALGTEVTVTPTQSLSNRFAFSWPEAEVSEGNTLLSYYYMINTPPPMTYATILANSAMYIPTTSNSIAEYSVPGLTKGSNTIFVVAVDVAGNYSPVNTISKTFYLHSELPDPPKDVIIADSSIKDVSMWRAAILWDEPDYKGTGSVTYHVQRSEDGEEWEDIATTTGRAHIDTVAESKQYFWRVASTDNSNESIANPSYSNAVSIIPRGKFTVPPEITSGPAASSITTTRSSITWTTSRTADSKVSIGLASGNYFEWEPSISTHKTEHRIPLSNLSPGTTYYYKAKWTDEDGNTGMSEEKTFTTEAPPTVKDVRLSNTGVSSTIVNFTTINASKAKVYYGTTASFGGMKEIATSKLETTYAIEIDRLEDGTKYYFQINTFDEEGEEYSGTILDFTTMPRPRVTNILVQQVAKTADSTLLVTWNSNTEVSSIVTFYPEGNPELMKDIVNLELRKGEHQMVVRGLFPDTVYVLTVRGRDIIGNEAVSETIRVTTASDTRPPQISNLTVEGINIPQAEGTAQTTFSQLIVTWNTDEPATSQVEYGEGSGSVYSQLTQEDKNLSYNHVVIISNLTPSKVYHLRAISKDAAGNEAKSIDTVTITPRATNNAFYLVITTLREAFGFLNKL